MTGGHHGATLSQEEIWRRLELLTDMGTAQLESGLGASRTIESMRSSAAGIDMPDLFVAVSGQSLTVQYVSADGTVSPRIGQAESVSTINCEHLRRLDEVSRAVSNRETDIDEANSRIREISASRMPAWWTVGGLTLLAFCIGLQVGGSLRMALCAAVVHLTAAVTGRYIGQFGIAPLFGSAVQSIAGAVVATLFYAIGVISVLEAAGAVAVSWMLLVPLPLVVILVVDIVTTNHLAAVARLSALILSLGGIIVGGAVVLSAAGAMDTQPPTEVDLPSLAIPLGLLVSILGAVGNALANSGGKALVLPAAVIGLVTASINQALLHLVGLSATWASTITAILLGLMVATWAKRSEYPTSVLALMGITGALLPGLTVFQGVAEELYFGAGLQYFAQAGLVAVCLGVGTTLGFQIASIVTSRQRDNLPVRRTERRK